LSKLEKEVEDEEKEEERLGGKEEEDEILNVESDLYKGWRNGPMMKRKKI